VQELIQTERVAPPGAVILAEDLYEVTDAGAAYLAAHSLADAPADEEL
jgi:hypothetical protein